MKKCSKCGVNKPNSEFHKRKKSRDGLQSACKVCNTSRVKDWQKENLDYWHTQRARADVISIQKKARLYGVTIEEMTKLLEATKCEICSTKLVKGNKYVDHDHITGKVRGILCGKCNRGLGHFNDDARLLEKAVQYIKNSGSIV